MTVPRRTFLSGALLGGTGAGLLTLTGCSPAREPTTATSTTAPATTTAGTPGAGTDTPDPEEDDALPMTPDDRTLVAYYSRAGENYWYGGRRTLNVGNTEVLVTMLAERTGWDVHRIEAAEPYPHDYDDTVARNVREQDSDARPRLAAAVPDLSTYTTLVLASPIWNVRPPMIMSTFVDALDLRGKRVLPITTHAMSGLGRAVEVYTALAPQATIGNGLAVRGEEVADAGNQLDAWLREVSSS